MELQDQQRRFDELYAEHRQTLHAFFLGRTSDPEQALDLLQEVFLRVWRNQLSMEAWPAERRRYWIFSVARNLVVDHYRHRAAGLAAQDALEAKTESPPNWAEQPDQTLEDKEGLLELDRAIRRLPDDLREVLVMQVVAGRTSSEIGEVLGKPAGTVRYQLVQARRRLADELRLTGAATP
jgi:RNA polymerase sigma factor (sigma-70 family)